MSRPLVSVILPTFNRAELLPGAVESVLAQSWRPLELLVVDDGSSDGTPALCQALKARSEQSGVAAVFLRQANAGPAAARNLALQRAGGDYIAFLDDDDRWYPDKTARELAALQSTGAEVAACLLLRPQTRDRRTKPRHAADLLEGRCAADFLGRGRDASIVSLLVTRDAARRAGPFDESLRAGEDTLWMYRLLLGATACNVPEVLGEAGDLPGSLSSGTGLDGMLRRDADHEAWLLRAREAGVNDGGWDEQTWRARVAQDYSELVKNRLYAGDLAGAREVFQRGMRLSAGNPPLPRVKRKIHKARLLSLFGRKLQHPKLRKEATRG